MFVPRVDKSTSVLKRFVPSQAGFMFHSHSVTCNQDCFCVCVVRHGTYDKFKIDDEYQEAKGSVRFSEASHVSNRSKPMEAKSTRSSDTAAHRTPSFAPAASPASLAQIVPLDTTPLDDSGHRMRGRSSGSTGSRGSAARRGSSNSPLSRLSQHAPGTTRQLMVR